MKAVHLAAATAVAVGLASAASAEEALKAAERFSGTTVAFDLADTYTGVTLTVTGPDDYQLIAASEKGSPAVDLRKGGTLSDGLYTNLLSGTTTAPKKVVRQYLDNGRDRGASPMVPASASGTFMVEKGSIMKIDPVQSER